MENHKPARWIVIVAAITFLVFLLAETRSLTLTAVVIGAIAAFIVYQNYQSNALAGSRCLKCGEPMSSTARWCKSCGSASWTRN